MIKRLISVQMNDSKVLPPLWAGPEIDFSWLPQSGVYLHWRPRRPRGYGIADLDTQTYHLVPDGVIGPMRAFSRADPSPVTSVLLLPPSWLGDIVRGA